MTTKKEAPTKKTKSVRATKGTKPPVKSARPAQAATPLSDAPFTPGHLPGPGNAAWPFPTGFQSQCDRHAAKDRLQSGRGLGAVIPNQGIIRNQTVAVGRTVVEKGPTRLHAIHAGPQGSFSAELPAEGDDKFNVPEHWTFKDAHVAEHFDQHVREQLPWYSLCTDIATHVGRHYLTEGGTMYDLGASTGNITASLRTEIEQRKVRAISIDNSEEMRPKFRGVGEFVVDDIRTYNFEPYDFGVCFLTLMFLQPEEQHDVVRRLVSNIKKGGALLIVDKTQAVGGYLGTVMMRLALAQKLKNGAPAADILTKELSLAGVQRPIQYGPLLSKHGAVEVFRFGDFAGWVISPDNC